MNWMVTKGEECDAAPTVFSMVLRYVMSGESVRVSAGMCDDVALVERRLPSCCLLMKEKRKRGLEICRGKAQRSSDRLPKASHAPSFMLTSKHKSCLAISGRKVDAVQEESGTACKSWEIAV